MKIIYTYYCSYRAYELMRLTERIDRESADIYRVDRVDTGIGWMALTYALRKKKLLKFPWEEKYFESDSE